MLNGFSEKSREFLNSFRDLCQTHDIGRVMGFQTEILRPFEPVRPLYAPIEFATAEE